MNKSLPFTALAFACVLLGAAALASAPVPETWPLCPAPQNISPIVSAGCAQIYARTAVAWSGKEYGTTWVDNADHRLHFRAFFADGTPVSQGVVVSSLVSDANYATSLIWNGVTYAVCWIARSPSLYNQAYFAKITRTGALVGSEVKASFAGAADTTPASAPSLAYSGSGYAVVWYDYRTGDADVFATLLNPDGTVANAGASHDLNLSATPQTQSMPAVAWSPAIGSYIVVWQDNSGGLYKISRNALTPDGSVDYASPIVSGTGDSEEPVVVDTGNGLGMAWYDSRDGNTEIYFCRLDASGYKVGSDLRLTNDASGSFRPAILWTGAEFGVLWYDGRGGGLYNIWYQRVTISGTLPGGSLNNIQLSFIGQAIRPAAAFAKYGFLATGANYGYGNMVIPVGCAGDTTPPTCPGNLLAYGITGTSATVSWSPSGEDASDLAYYIVYRNNAQVALTSDTFYSDSGLSLSTTYNYMVQPVNAAQMQNYSCTTSMYLKTNATLLLMLDKNDPDAQLTWSDITLNNYNVFRGTSPQVMQQIGSTGGQSFSDPNVLLDNVLYFYTVDDPGW